MNLERNMVSLFVSLALFFLLVFFTPICHFSLILQALWGRDWFMVTLLGSYIAPIGVSQSLHFLITWVNCAALRKFAVYFLLHFASPFSALDRGFAALNTLWTCQCPAALSVLSDLIWDWPVGAKCQHQSLLLKHTDSVWMSSEFSMRNSSSVKSKSSSFHCYLGKELLSLYQKKAQNGVFPGFVWVCCDSQC